MRRIFFSSVQNTRFLLYRYRKRYGYRFCLRTCLGCKSTVFVWRFFRIFSGMIPRQSHDSSAVEECTHSIIKLSDFFFVFGAWCEAWCGSSPKLHTISTLPTVIVIYGFLIFYQAFQFIITPPIYDFGRWIFRSTKNSPNSFKFMQFLARFRPFSVILPPPPFITTPPI